MTKKRRLINENPLLEQQRLQAYNQRLDNQGVMTVSSTLTKSFCALMVTLLMGAYIWFNYDARESLQLYYYISGWSFVILLGLSFALSARPLWAKYLIFPYAILMGLLLGCFSKVADYVCPGLVFQAFLGTFIVFCTVAFISINEVIKLDSYMRKRIYTMTFALAVLYSIDYILWKFGIYSPFDNMINGDGWVGIIFSLFVIVLASFCLLADMDNIKLGAKKRYAKEAEWYCAMVLLATILWIYIEILRLLIKLQGRKRRS